MTARKPPIPMTSDPGDSNPAEFTLDGHPPPPSGRRKPTRPNGYAGTPGRGPEGETCKTCEHYTRIRYHGKVYRKCGLLEGNWTHGPGTDILARSPACQLWEKSKESE